ncbi:STAS domain-containing protein [Streptomyces sp. NBC_01335]|uniref:STAS domain-containing protein n=1 Tax=Streptomyces sp. NBC_01335 TaxID=2903828 RepID=UPI002E0E5C4F|nr:STAS domain-containing protein [Streptomyces sp. NBC_01335]
MTGRKRPDRGTAFLVRTDGFALVRVRGDADENSGAPELAEALGAALRMGKERTVVDLSETEFADSAVLHTLLDARARHERAGVGLVLAGPFRTAVRRLFEVTGTAGAFTMATSVEEAATC